MCACSCASNERNNAVGIGWEEGSVIDILSEEACVSTAHPTKVASLPYGGVYHRGSSPSYLSQQQLFKGKKES